jgi:peptidoglycan/xylan/chitin deacetylase (PgdA/CDA1 family)
MVGYGAAPPDAQWPGGARIALQIVLNYEEGGENCILHGDPASEAFLSESVGAVPWPGQRNLNMESVYEYGSRAGFWRLHRMFTERAIPLTVFAVATALMRNPAAAAAMREAGWEIASHGLKWIDYKDFSRAEEKRHLDEAIRIHTAGHRRAAARLVHRALLGAHHRAGHGRRRLRVLRRLLRRRPALLDRRPQRPAPDRALHARCQRHALCLTPGLQLGRPVLHLPQGQLRRALCGRRRRPGQDAVGRAALPARRPPGARRGARPLPRLCRATSTSGSPAASTSPATGARLIRPCSWQTRH